MTNFSSDLTTEWKSSRISEILYLVDNQRAWKIY